MAKRATATVTRVAGNKEGKCGKGNGNINESGGQGRGPWQGWQEQWKWQQGWWVNNKECIAKVGRAIAKAMRLAGIKECNGEDSKSNYNGTKVPL